LDPPQLVTGRPVHSSKATQPLIPNPDVEVRLSTKVAGPEVGPPVLQTFTRKVTV